jgi:membrane protease YdiL (CAAX protease family)
MKSPPSASNKPAGLWQYFVLTFAISWAAWGALIVFGIPGGSVSPDAPPPPPLGLFLLALGGFAPAIAAAIVTGRTGGRAGLRALWRSLTQFDLGWAPYGVIFGVPLLAALTRVGVHWLGGGTLLKPPLLADPMLLFPFTAQIFIVGPLSEEPGWRGFALGRLLVRWGFWPATLVVGGLHAAWHLPTFFVEGTIQHAWGNPPVEFAVFAAAVLAGAPIYTWLHVASGGRAWAAILFHATSNFGMSFVWLVYQGTTADRLVFALVLSALSALLIGLVRPGQVAARPRMRPRAGRIAL